jgi:hypothetical protein
MANTTHTFLTVRISDIKEVQEVVSALTDYVQLLTEELDTVTPLASAHGWSSNRVEAGTIARKRIEQAMKSLEATTHG